MKVVDVGQNFKEAIVCLTRGLSGMSIPNPVCAMCMHACVGWMGYGWDISTVKKQPHPRQFSNSLHPIHTSKPRSPQLNSIEMPNFPASVPNSAISSPTIRQSLRVTSFGSRLGHSRAGCISPRCHGLRASHCRRTRWMGTI